MVKTIWPLVRIVQFFYHIPIVILNIRNWWDYYLDLFSLKKIGSHWTMDLEDKKIRVRSRTADRWIAFENLVLEKGRGSVLLIEDLDTVVDLGANIGASVIDFHSRFPKADLIAVEPNQNNLTLLRDNIKINEFQDKVTVIPAAVSNSSAEKVDFFINKNDGESSLLRKAGEEIMQVDNIHFSDLERYIKGKTLLKMDIEGQEYSFLKESYLDVFRKFDYLIIEGHIMSEDRDPKVIKRFLDKHDFNYYKKGKYFFIDNVKNSNLKI